MPIDLSPKLGKSSHFVVFLFLSILNYVSKDLTTFLFFRANYLSFPPVLSFGAFYFF